MSEEEILVIRFSYIYMYKGFQYFVRVLVNSEHQLPVVKFIYLSPVIYLSIYLSISVLTYIFIYISVFISIYLSGLKSCCSFNSKKYNISFNQKQKKFRLLNFNYWRTSYQFSFLSWLLFYEQFQFSFCLLFFFVLCLFSKLFSGLVRFDL